MSEQKTCETCRWWTHRKPAGDKGQDLTGSCHGAPPTAKDRYVLWPLTRHYDFCGQHTEKETDK